MIGVEEPDGAALQISNMVHNAVKPDLTIVSHGETLQMEGKSIIAVDIQRGMQCLFLDELKPVPRKCRRPFTA